MDSRGIFEQGKQYNNNRSNFNSGRGTGAAVTGTSAAGTSAAGTSAAGTSAAGTSAAGTSAAGTGTSAAGTSFREGFYGIASTDVDASINKLNRAEQSVLNAKKSLFDTYTTALSNSKKALSAKINEYAKSMQSSKLNYNLFSNRLPHTEDIKMNSSEQCINSAVFTAANSGYTIDPAFNIAYPTPPEGATAGTANFSTFAKAKKACQTWAYDSKKPLFGVTKKHGGGYNCYTATARDTTALPPYVFEKVAYTIASSNGATFGGLFANGQIGIYNGIKKDIESNKQFYNNSISGSGMDTTSFGGVSSCDIWNGGRIVPSSITASYGRNCNNVGNVKPIKVRYVRINASKNNFGESHIQISQLAVYAFVQGVSINVAKKANLPDASDSSSSHNISASDHRANNMPAQAVDGTLATRSIDGGEGGYHSKDSSTSNYWLLDLGKEYDVYKIVYYNRKDCCQSRANGMTLVLQDKNAKIIASYSFNSDLVQDFNINASTATILGANAAAPTFNYDIINPPEANRTYSSVFGLGGTNVIGTSVPDSVNAKSVLSNGNGSWRPIDTSKTNPNQHLTIDLVNSTTVAGVVIQAPVDMDTSNQYVTKFKVQYWNTTLTPAGWSYVKTSGNDGPDGFDKEFTGLTGSPNRPTRETVANVNFGMNTYNTTLPPNTPLTYNTTKIRIIPIDWNNAISMRAAVLKLIT